MSLFVDAFICFFVVQMVHGGRVYYCEMHMPRPFTDLKIWQDGVELLEKVYKLTAKFPSTERYGLIDQLRRASNSIVANIAESQGRFSYKDKIRVLYQARGEIFEVRSHILVAQRIGYIQQDECYDLDHAYENLVKSTNSYIRHIASKMS